MQAIGGASITAAVAPVAELKPSTVPQMTGDPRHPVDGRTQLELWAKANGTTVEGILSEKTNGFLTLKNKSGKGGDNPEPATAEAATEEGAPQTDEGKTASVDAEGGEPSKAGAASDMLE